MLHRMIIDKIENRILVGLIMFVALMVLIGWVAINENARMASFERQYEARAIEHGAEKFAANCATCHGEDGRGILGRAPALNSPHLFGFDYFEDINREMGALEAEELALNEELTALADEFAQGVEDDREEAILERRQEISERLNGEEGIVARKAELLEERDALVSALQPAIAAGYPLSVNSDGELTNDFSRLAELEWGGTLEDFLFTTLIHGRPTSVGYWPAAMVSWSDRAGGPLRDDQLENITTYIMNWDKGDDWTIEDALAVNQYGIVPGIGNPPSDVDTVGIDAAEISSHLEQDGFVGDPVRGEALYSNVENPEAGGPGYACSGCHAGGAAAPDTVGTWDRVVNERLTLDQFADYTPEQYVIESIVAPGDYVVPGYAAGAMPGDFGDRMSYQDMADILAYIEAQ